MSKWTPVSRPPDSRRYVLVYNGLHEEIAVGEYVPDEQMWRGPYGRDEDHDITHWMPLPKPPEKSEPEQR